MLLCLSVNHRTASFAVLDRLSAGHSGPEQHLDDDGVRGAVTVSTCNRFETYLDVDAADSSAVASATQAALTRYAEAARMDVADVRPVTQVMTASRVAAHLFAVTSGLESVAVGEEQIAGQVRRALAQARASGSSTVALEQLFQMASATSRGVRNTTRINAAGRSMVRLALDLAESRIASWEGTRVLLVGTGAYARTTLAALRARGARHVAVASPSGRQAQFATREHVQPVTPGKLAAALADADLVITSTNLQVLDAAALSPAREGAGRPLLIIDLGLPANVAKDVTSVPGVGLLDLETIGVHAPVQELNASAQARDLVNTATEEFAARSAQEIATPAIVAFRDRIDELVEVELTRAKTRGEYSPETERVLRHFASVLVHAPTARARELAGQGRLDEFTQALRVLHGVDIAGMADGEGQNTRAAG